MHNDHDHEIDEDAKFEPTDANVPAVLIVGVILVAVTAASFLAGYFFLRYSTARPAATAYEASPLIANQPEEWTLDVRLQDDLEDDLSHHIAATLPALNAHGIVSDSPEIYHFPIDQAIEYVIDAGQLPEFKPIGDGSLEGTGE